MVNQRGRSCTCFHSHICEWTVAFGWYTCPSTSCGRNLLWKEPCCMSLSTKLTTSFHIGIPLHCLSAEETTPIKKCSFFFTYILHMSMQTSNLFLFNLCQTSNSNLNIDLQIGTFKFRQNKFLMLEYKSNDVLAWNYTNQSIQNIPGW